MKTQKFYNLIIFSIAIILIIIVSILVFLNLRTVATTEKQNPSPSPEQAHTPLRFSFPTLSPLPTLKATTADITSVVKKMPVITETYSIEYLTTSDLFVVIIKKSPYETNLALAKAWFQQENIDLDTINIIFYKYRFVQ